MSDNKTAELMVEAFLRSGLSTADAIEEIRDAERKERRKKEHETWLTTLIFRHIPAAAVGILLFVLLVNQM